MFTIGFVNYKTSVYMDTQLKIYQNFAGEKFTIIIADTSNVDEEFERLNKVCKNFPNLDIRTFQLNTFGRYGSDAHGTGLQSIYEQVKTDYFLTQDPDFFWVSPGFLTFLRSKLQNYVVVGAPYHVPAIAGWSGHPLFPAAFGAVHCMKDLQEVQADFRYSEEPVVGDVKGAERDVGWQIREKLKDRPYYYFDVKSANLPIGKTYSRTFWQRYFDKQITIAYHLQRGSFETVATEGLRLAYHGRFERRERLRRMQAPKEWEINRKKACDFFWKEINTAGKIMDK